VDLRGNVNTRLQKLDNGEYDAIILAAAGLKRLEFEDRITQFIETDICLPAIGQGAVGIECRSDDAWVNNLIAPLNDTKTQIRVLAERAMNKRQQLLGRDGAEVAQTLAFRLRPGCAEGKRTRLRQEPKREPEQYQEHARVP